MEQRRMYRQGDVLILEVKDIPGPAHRKDDNIIMHGEITGHAHRLIETIEEEEVAAIYERGSDMYLDVVAETMVVHDEHKPLTLAPGKYQVVRQREYNEEFRERPVFD